MTFVARIEWSNVSQLSDSFVLTVLISAAMEACCCEILDVASMSHRLISATDESIHCFHGRDVPSWYSKILRTLK